MESDVFVLDAGVGDDPRVAIADGVDGALDVDGDGDFLTGSDDGFFVIAGEDAGAIDHGEASGIFESGDDGGHGVARGEEAREAGGACGGDLADVILFEEIIEIEEGFIGGIDGDEIGGSLADGGTGSGDRAGVAVADRATRGDDGPGAWIGGDGAWVDDDRGDAEARAADDVVDAELFFLAEVEFTDDGVEHDLGDAPIELVEEFEDLRADIGVSDDDDGVGVFVGDQFGGSDDASVWLGVDEIDLKFFGDIDIAGA